MTPSRVSARPRIQPIIALRAMRRLVRNPEDTQAAFVVAEALRGRSSLPAFRRFRNSEVGGAVLRERRSLLDTLSNRAALAALPAGTLGRAYHDFMAEQNLTAEGLVEASRATRSMALPDEMEFYATRMRDMHDLFHVVTGYGRHPLGEVCVLAFTYAQTRARGVGAIALLGLYKIARALPGYGIPRVVLEAYRHGKRAAWFPEQDWENLMAEPLNAVRARLNVQYPSRFEQVMARFQNRTRVWSSDEGVTPEPA